MWSFRSRPSSDEQYFDFDKAVAEARRDFPEETRNLTVINLDDPDAMRQIRQWERSLDRDSLQVLWENGILDTLTPEHSGATITAPYSGQRLIMIHGRDNGNTPFFPGNPLKQAAFAFFHELGHVVVKHDMYAFDPQVNKGESGADVFAIIRGAQKGIFDKKDAKHIADARLVEALTHGGFDHLTTMAVDSLIINPQNTKILSLTPQQAAKVAKAHADAFATDERAEHNLTSVFNGTGFWGQPTEQSMLRNLANIALKTSSQTHEFYIATRALLAVARKSGPDRLARAFGTSPQQLKAIYDKVAEKAGNRDIGAIEAVKNPSWGGGSVAALKEPEPGIIEKVKNWFFPKPMSI